MPLEYGAPLVTKNILETWQRQFCTILLSDFWDTFYDSVNIDGGVLISIHDTNQGSQQIWVDKYHPTLIILHHHSI